MSWRKSVRKQINKAKSRKVENAITEKIAKSNRAYYEAHKEEIHQYGRSVSYDFIID